MKARSVDAEEYEKKATKEHVDPSSLQPTVLEGVEYSVRRYFGRSGEAPEIEDSEDGEINVRGFLVEPARVGVELGRTINMGPGSYETSKVGVTVSVPCYREELEEAYEYANEFAKKRLSEKVRSINEYIQRRSR